MARRKTARLFAKKGFETMRLSKIKDEVRTAVYTLPSSDTIEIGYKPSAWTMQFLDDLSKADSRETANLLAGCLDSLGVTDDNDKPIPLDGQTLYENLPFMIVDGILNAITEAEKPAKKSKTGSFASSAETD